MKRVLKIAVILFCFAVQPMIAQEKGGADGGESEPVEVPKMKQNKKMGRGKKKDNLFGDDKKSKNKRKIKRGNSVERQSREEKKRYRKSRRKQQRPKTTRRMRKSDRKAKKVNKGKGAPLVKRVFH